MRIIPPNYSMEEVTCGCLGSGRCTLATAHSAELKEHVMDNFHSPLANRQARVHQSPQHGDRILFGGGCVGWANARAPVDVVADEIQRCLAHGVRDV